ncbi:MAG: HSP20 family protein [Spirochaetes bacterium]|nr:MAG: HSP20 family protein [Spirochaetota bacterium]
MKNLAVYDASPFSLIDQFFSNDLFNYENYRSPSIDVREENDRYVLEAELPGLNERDIKLEMKDDVLTLATAAMEDKKESGSQDGRWIRRERRKFKFSRSFSLPQDADREKIEARFRDGLLTVEIPKKPETAPRIVPVKVA